MYLQEELPQYSVDCEFNRTGIDPKRIDYDLSEASIGDTEGRTVFPDVIAHVRGRRDNYLVIELKKSNSTVSRSFDLQKLRGYKKDEGLSYKYALFLVVAVGEEPGVACAQWVDD
jgi:hypothetical protein